MTDNKTPAQPPRLPPQAPPSLSPPPPLPKPNFSVSSVKMPTPVAAPLSPLPKTAPVNTESAALPPASTLQKAAPAQMPQPGVMPSTANLPKPPTTPLPPAPKPAEFQQSPLRFLPFVIGLLLLVGLGYFIFTRVFARRPTTSTSSTVKTTTTGSTASKNVVLTYWGLWEPSRVMQASLAEFQRQNPTITVNYQQQTARDYRERLQTEIARGRGPDVFRFHASWVPMLKAELAPVPATAYSPVDFQTTFYPVAVNQLRLNNNFVGIPLEYDGLALFYNKEALRTASAEPPRTWNELKQLAPRLTIRGGDKIERAGMAIGNASNIDHFAEILALLMLQNGASPADPTTPKAQEAIKFYTDFYTQDRVWSETLPNSTVAFARGDVAMIFAPSWRAHDILAMNPNLAFGVVPVPQLSSTKISWASYWAEGVSAQSKNKDAAWKLLKFLSSQEGQQQLFSDASKERAFGEPYARVDLANQLADSPYLAAVIADAPFAQSWYVNGATNDNGLNDQIVKYYEDAITAIVGGGDPESAMSTVSKGIQQLLRQYNVSRQ